MAQISIIGSYPPNYGGISVHVQRLHLLLEQSHSCRVKDLYSVGGEQHIPGVERFYGNKFQRIWKCRTSLRDKPSDIEHFHVSAMRKFLWGTPVLLTGRARSKRVLTIHGGAFPDVVAGLKTWEKRLFAWMLKQFDHFVCVSEKQRKVLEEWHIPAHRISVVNAYMPPVKSPPSGLFSAVEQEKAAGKKILVFSCMYLEHYGIEELIKAITLIEKKYSFRLVLVSYGDVDESYRAKCLALRESITPFFEYERINPTQIAELFALSDIFVRPTWWDGDAVTLREAAYFGNQLIATDVTTRPDGTVLCHAKDPQSLSQALQQCIEDSTAGIVEFDHHRSLRELTKVYSALGADFD